MTSWRYKVKKARLTNLQRRKTDIIGFLKNSSKSAQKYPLYAVLPKAKGIPVKLPVGFKI